MIYLQVIKDQMYHKDKQDKRGRRYTVYYRLYQGQLLTLCEAIQKFEIPVDDIMRANDLDIVRINRTYTYRDKNDTRYIRSGHNSQWLY